MHTLLRPPENAAPRPRRTGLPAALLVALLVLTALPTFAPARAAQANEEPAAPVITPVDDQTLAAQVNGVLGQVANFKEITATVSQGVVHLAGQAPSATAADQAARLTARFPGVVYVDNAVGVDIEIESRLAPALTKLKQYGNRLIGSLPVFAVALVIFLFAWFLSRLVTHSERLFALLGVNLLIQNLLRQVLRGAIILVGALLALEVLDMTALVGAVAGTAGLVGLAVGFAFKDIVENYLAGAMLSLRSPFSIGDLIRVGEHEGRVLRLTTRELVIMSLDGNHLRLPSSHVFKSVIVNYTRNPLRLFSFEVGVGSGEDLVDVQTTGVAALAAMKGVMDDPAPFSRLERLGDWNVVMGFYGWVDQRHFDFFKVQSEAIRLVKAALDRAGLSMPDPIQTVRLERAARPELAPEAAAPSAAAAGEADVAPDTDLTEQMDEDLASSPEPNLLQTGTKPRS